MLAFGQKMLCCDIEPLLRFEGGRQNTHQAIPQHTRANYGHVTISSIVAMLLARGRFKYIKMFGEDNTDVQNASHAVGPTATILGPQLMSFSPLKSSLQCNFGMIAIVSSVLLDQADLPK